MATIQIGSAKMNAAQPTHGRTSTSAAARLIHANQRGSSRAEGDHGRRGKQHRSRVERRDEHPVAQPPERNSGPGRAVPRDRHEDAAETACRSTPDQHAARCRRLGSRCEPSDASFGRVERAQEPMNQKKKTTRTRSGCSAPDRAVLLLVVAAEVGRGRIATGRVADHVVKMNPAMKSRLRSGQGARSPGASTRERRIHPALGSRKGGKTVSRSGRTQRP